MESDDPLLARIDRHLAEGNEIVRQNTRAFQDLRAFLGEMTEVLHALVRSVNETTAELREHRQEFREERQEFRENSREERREFREEMAMQRAALIAVLDQLRGGGAGEAPAT